MSIGDADIVAALLNAGVDDRVSLDEVTWEVMQGDASGEAKLATLRVLDRLYRDRLMVPGDLGESGFEDWPVPPEEWLSRSREELERLDWKPMGAGFWLRLTEHGEEVAQARYPPGT